MTNTSNIIFALDSVDQGFTNLVGQDNLVEKWELPRWLDHCRIQYNTVDMDHATSQCWYPVSVNFWDFAHDYLGRMSTKTLEKIRNGTKLLFYYREGDSPSRIRQHIDAMCQQWSVSKDRVLLLSGNTLADHIPGSRFWWHFEHSYYFQTLQQPLPQITTKPRSHRITLLSRTHKPWREWFVYNVWRYARGHNYISYGQVRNLDPGQDLELWQGVHPPLDRWGPTDLCPPDWHDLLPLRADDLTSDQHNDHARLIPEHYQDSYWNVVLETLLATEDHGGVFVTEKTLKPIRNGQGFLVLGCARSLEFLRSRGYQSFSPVINEDYDSMQDLRWRWWRVYRRTQALLRSKKLHRMQILLQDVISHNQRHFMRDRTGDLTALVDQLKTFTP